MSDINAAAETIRRYLHGRPATDPPHWPPVNPLEAKEALRALLAEVEQLRHERDKAQIEAENNAREHLRVHELEDIVEQLRAERDAAQRERDGVAHFLEMRTQILEEEE